MPKNVSSQKNPKRPNNGEAVIRAEWSGPLPPPRLLEGYENIHPGFAERIVRMAEEEGIHRRQLESRMVKADIEAEKAVHREVRLGQVFAFILTFLLIGGGIFLIYNDKQISGAVVSGIGFVGIITAFLSRRKNHSEKQE